MKKIILYGICILIMLAPALAEITGTIGGGGAVLTGTVDGISGTVNPPSSGGGSPLILKGGGSGDNGGFECEPNWSCTQWGACEDDNMQKRTCTDETGSGGEGEEPVGLLIIRPSHLR